MNRDAQTGPQTGAEAALKAAIEAALEAARALHRQDRLDEALEAYRRILDGAPDNPEILNYAAVIQFQLGGPDEAIQLAERAVAARPDFIDAHNNLGLMLQNMGHFDQALAAYRRVVDLVPETAEPVLNTANVLLLMERHEDAVDEYRRVISINPRMARAHTSLAKSLLGLGRWQDAVDACEQCLAAAPGDAGALSLKSAALGALGDTRALHHLVDFDRLIQLTQFDAPPGHDSLKAFNQALAEHCLAHPTLTFEPQDNTTVKGHQSGDLMIGEKGPVAQLATMIMTATEHYQKAVPADPAHPFLAGSPAKCWVNAWATILGDGGHQATHVHRSGWLSGVYYVQVPDAIGANETKDGWIEFGRLPLHGYVQPESDVRYYQPKVGLMVMFPSYFYHRTVPFRSEDKRISIAFDIIPDTG